ncbi:MAG: SAM-dependent methyltransferase [Methylophilaceae bacterium]|nr:SAM-dependent methyltransferase [Methylophilaceae bacterium]
MRFLPLPSSEALDRSARLTRLIRTEIESAGGWIGFDRYMSLALYTPGLGYYSAETDKFGSMGDFVTAPEISPLFGRCLAKQIAQVLSEIGGDILELGAGRGRLAVDLLIELEQRGCAPERYFILEISSFLQNEQKKLIESNLSKATAQKVVWLDALPEHFSGVVLGNELLDALPVHIVAVKPDGLYVRGVAWENEAFAWKDQRLEKGEVFEAASRLGLSAGYVSEIGLASQALMARMAEMLEEGVILMLDYGFPQREYYHPQRVEGTLMCHYRHYAHGNPLLYPGLQDITAHVDFSAVAAAACAHGAALMGFTTQAQFLINCGMIDLLSETSPSDDTYLPQVAQVQKLLSPSEMGELFKVLAVGKGICIPLIGFSQGDRCHVL